MKLPKPKKTPSGKWHCSVMVNGKRMSITAVSKKQCELLALELKQTTQISSDVTLYDAISKYILSRSNVLSPCTIMGYRTIQKKRFQSVTEMHISDITDWQMVINAEAELCSAKTLKNAWGFIKSVLRQNNIPIPEVTLPQIAKNERPYLDPDEVLKFVDAIKGHPFEANYLLGLHSLRLSEMLALKRTNIQNNIITVRGSVVPNEFYKLVRKDTNKNASSTRSIPILIPRLKQLIKKEIPKPSPSTLRRQLAVICKENGLPVISYHGLRHSFASLAFHLGLKETETMRLGGWSDPATMRKIYVHLSEKQKNTAAAKIEEFFSKEKSVKKV